MAAQSKTHLLTEIYTLLKKRYRLEPREERMTVLEAVVYAICHEGTTREQANQALSRLKDDFYDWNEVRVSSIDEIQRVLADLPDPEERAYKVRRFLRQLFEKTYGFALDGLGKKPLKEASKQLQEYEAPQEDFVLATVIQKALGGHAIPVDGPMRRGLERLGVADKSAKDVALRGLLDRAIPKNRGADFADLMEALTHDVCVEGTPDCPHCDLKKLCPTGHARLAERKAGAKAAAKAEKQAVKVGKGGTAAKAKKGTAAPAAKEPVKSAPKAAAAAHAKSGSSKAAAKSGAAKATKPKKPAAPAAKSKPKQAAHPSGRKTKPPVEKRKPPRSK
jgi:endonuclease-3